MSTVVQRPAYIDVFAGTGDTSMLLLRNYHMSSHRLERDELRGPMIQNQYNKNNTLVDHVCLRRHRNIAMEPEDPEVTKNFDMPVPSYFRYLQCQETKDVNFTAGLIMLRNRFTEAERT